MSFRQDAAHLQKLANNAFCQTGTLVALADSGTPDPDKLQKALEQAAAQFESAALEVRKLCERHSTGTGGYGSRPVLPPIEIAGSVEMLGYSWVHITLNTLLPHCRFQPPEWLSDTIRRLLDDYEAQGCKLPFFNRALLVIDEFTSVKGRHIFDQDNKGWKAVSNAIKGRLIPDDDQHTLGLALLSAESELDACHITLLDLSDAADFFAFHSGDYEVKHFYSGGWS